MTGVEFLSRLKEARRFEKEHKILLPGLASHEDSIAAINQGSIDYYIAKSWKRDELVSVVRQQLTHAIFAQRLEYESFLPWLDQPTLYAMLRKTV